MLICTVQYLDCTDSALVSVLMLYKQKRHLQNNKCQNAYSRLLKHSAPQQRRTVSAVTYPRTLQIGLNTQQLKVLQQAVKDGRIYLGLGLGLGVSH